MIRLVLRQVLEHLLYPPRACVMAANYYLGHFRDVVWVFGDGRSGTTWVSDLVNWDESRREMFEPFHPKMVRGMQELCFYQYIRPGDSEHRFFRRASAVFSGRFCSVRTDHANWRLSYRGLLIKDIFANLLACWAARQFPAVKMVFLIRNPFAVALSKFRRKGWNWLTDPSELLAQQPLVHDHLQPFEDVIRGVGDDFILRQVLIWAILHYVPLRQFEPGRIRVVFYEDVVRHPERELLRLFRYLKPDSADCMTQGALGIVARPSRVTGRRKRAAGGPWPIGQWRKEVSGEQLREGLKILAHFGLDQLYGDDAMPRPEFLPGPEARGRPA
jgi:hypothetical protein